MGVTLKYANKYFSKLKQDSSRGFKAPDPPREPNKARHQRLGGHLGERVGEAKHPGPPASLGPNPEPCRSPKPPLKSLPKPLMRLITCNCGNARGFWSALDLADTHPQRKHLLAIALQEIRCSAHEIQALRRAAQKRGFKVFYTIGEPTDNGFGVRRERGGVAWLVDKRLQVRFLKDFVGVHSQVSCLQVEGWALANFYAPPGTGAAAEVEVCQALLNMMLEFPTEFKQWIWCGDANEVPCDSNIASLGTAHSGTTLTTGRGTRWLEGCTPGPEGKPSSREIDWY